MTVELTPVMKHTEMPEGQREVLYSSISKHLRERYQNEQLEAGRGNYSHVTKTASAIWWLLNVFNSADPDWFEGVMNEEDSLFIATPFTAHDIDRLNDAFEVTTREDMTLEERFTNFQEELLAVLNLPRG